MTRAGAMRVRGVSALLLVLMSLLAGQGARAQPATPVAVVPLVATSTVEVDFPRGLVIQASLAWVGDGEGDLELLFHVAGSETETLVPVPDAAPAGDGSMTRVEAVVDLQTDFVPPGVEIAFTWRITEDAVVLAQSAPESTTWYDTRWEWQEIASRQVTLQSYGLDPAFADAVLALAQETVTDLEQRYGLERSSPLSIWVYPNAEDFQGAQMANTREAIAGASYTGYFLIMAVIGNGDWAAVGRVIPHEVSHQVLFQATDNPFVPPPLWFDEGLATHYQVGDSAGYPEIVRRAWEEDRLFSLDALEVSFPYAPAEASLAYAVSWSAVEYITRQHGDEGVAALIRAFSIGVPYDDAIETALGIDGAQLNQTWRDWVAAQAG